MTGGVRNSLGLVALHVQQLSTSGKFMFGEVVGRDDVLLSNVHGVGHEEDQDPFLRIVLGRCRSAGIVNTHNAVGL